MAWQELTGKRKRTCRTYADGSLRRCCSTLAVLHYESVLDSGVFDAEVDAMPQRVVNVGFDGWRVTANEWHYALGRPAGLADGWVGFGGRQGAHWFKFRLARAGYLHWPMRAWQDVGGTPTYDRAALSNEIRSLTIGPDEDQVNVEGIAIWQGIWATPGGDDVSIRWKIRGVELKEEVIVSRAAREWIRDNRPPTTLASETWFGFVFQLDWSDVPQVVRDGIVLSPDDDFSDDGHAVELRDAAGRLLGFMPVGAYTAGVRGRAGGGVESTALQKRFWKDGDGNHYLLVGVRCDVLNGLKDGPLVFDPTFNIASTLRDACSQGNNGGASTAYETNTLPGSMAYGAMYLGRDADTYPADYADLDGGWIWETTIADGATITAATVALDNGGGDNVLPLAGDWWGYDVDSPGDFTDGQAGRASDHETKTTASVTDNINTDGNHTSPDLKTIVQEIVNRGGVGANPKIGLTWRSTLAVDKWYEWSDYTDDSAKAADLTVTWAAEKTGSITADATIKRVGLSGSVTADAALKRAGLSGSVTADAALKRIGESGSVTADATVKRVGLSGPVTADAALKRAGLSGSVTADAAVKRTGLSSSVTADAAVKKAVADTITADATLKRVGLSDSVTADAVLKQAQAGSITADSALKQAGVSATITADAAVKKTATGSVTADAALKKAQSGSVTADAALKKSATDTVTADAALKKAQAGSITADAVLKRTGFSASITADAALKAAQSNSITADAALKHAQSGSIKANAALKRAGVSGAITADAALKHAQAGSITADAALKKAQSGGITADSALKRTGLSATITADAAVKKAAAASVTADAVLKRTGVSGTITADATLKQTGVSGTVTADAAVRRAQAGSITADAAVKRTGLPGSVLVDAALKRLALTGAVTADAAVKRTGFSGSVTADAILARTRTGSVTADATLFRSGLGGTVTADAALKRIGFGASVTADAALKRTGFGGSIKADATIIQIVYSACDGSRSAVLLQPDGRAADAPTPDTGAGDVLVPGTGDGATFVPGTRAGEGLVPTIGDAKEL